MTQSSSSSKTQFNVSVFRSRDLLDRAAAVKSAAIIREAISQRGSARLLVATGNSQLDVVRHLVDQPVEWGKVDVFHLDEYVGIPPNHPASFNLWIRTRFVEPTRPRFVDYLNGLAADPDAEARRYSAQLAARPVDIAFVGIGENGHIAFNEPQAADFNDPLLVKRVTLDEQSRRQQVGEGHFPDMASVPQEALTVSCTGLLRASHWICCVPERRKAAAVRASLEGQLTTECPGSLIRTHPKAFVYLDTESASLLSDAPPVITM